MKKSDKLIEKAIEEHFNKFFQTWYKLVNDKMKKGLEFRKELLKFIFYVQVTRAAKENYYLTTFFDAIDNLNINPGTGVKIRLNEIVNEEFRLPNLVLSSFETSTASFQNELNDSHTKYLGLNNEYSIAVSKLKTRNLESKKKGKKHKEFYSDIIAKHSPEFINKIKGEAERCRNNGNISYRELGRRLNVSHPTAKRWCKLYGIPKKILQLNTSSKKTAFIKVRGRAKKRRA